MSAPLCVIGDFAWDVLIRTNSKLLTGGDTFGEVMLTPGGSAANVAVWAARCGLHTEFIGKIGRDRLGQLAQEDLAKENGRSPTSSRPTSTSPVVSRSSSTRPANGRWCRAAAPTSICCRPRCREETVRRSGHLHMTAWSFFVDPPRVGVARRCAPRAGLRGDAVVRSRLVPDDRGDGRQPVPRRARRISASTCSCPTTKRARC